MKSSFIWRPTGLFYLQDFLLDTIPINSKSDTYRSVIGGSEEERVAQGLGQSNPQQGELPRQRLELNTIA